MSSRKDPFQKLCRSFLCRTHATVSRPWCCSGSNLKDVLLIELCMYLTMCSARRLVTCRYSSTTNPSSECAVPVNLRSSSDNAEFWRPTEHCRVCLVLDQVAWHALTHGQPSTMYGPNSAHYAFNILYLCASTYLCKTGSWVSVQTQKHACDWVWKKVCEYIGSFWNGFQLRISVSYMYVHSWLVFQQRAILCLDRD